MHVPLAQRRLHVSRRRRALIGIKVWCSATHRPPATTRIASNLDPADVYDFPSADIFLPSYADRESSELERRKDPVHDIVLTDEEADSVFPS